METLGIENVKTASKNVVGLIKEISKAYSDDQKIDTGEIVGMIDDAIPLLKDMTKAKVILAEFRDFDTKEGKEYFAYLISLGILPEKANGVAILIINYIEYQINGYFMFVEPIIKELKKK